MSRAAAARIAQVPRSCTCQQTWTGRRWSRTPAPLCPWHGHPREVPMATGYRRRDLLERHSRRTGMTVSHAPLEDSQKRVLEGAALTVCDRYGRAEAADLLAMLGLVHPDGPANVGVRVVAGSKPVPHAHMRRGRAK